MSDEDVNIHVDIDNQSSIDVSSVTFTVRKREGERERGERERERERKREREKEREREKRETIVQMHTFFCLQLNRVLRFFGKDGERGETELKDQIDFTTLVTQHHEAIPRGNQTSWYI